MFKTDNHNNCNNYHPISLLHSISKIIEKLIHTHLTISLDKHNIKKGSLVFDIITPQHMHTERSQKNIKQGSDSGKYACQRFLDSFCILWIKIYILKAIPLAYKGSCQQLVVEGIRAYKLFLNLSKTELVIFKSRYKEITKHPNICVSGTKTPKIIPDQIHRGCTVRRFTLDCTSD